MSGYNSSIFAYGQTGAGKTYTMLGQLPNFSGNKGSSEGDSTVDKVSCWWAALQGWQQ
jgi:hypothetical protein